MSWAKETLLASAVVAMAFASPAGAADIIPEPPVVELQPVQQFGGWYLRGDLSIDWVEDFDVTYAGNSFTNAEIDQNFNFGIGIGYQFNQYFRADLTLERFGSNFSGSTVGSCAYDAGGVYVDGSCVSSESADFSAWSAMVNGYFDLGNFNGLTPYAGAGLGASYVSWNDYRSVDTCTRTSVATEACYSGGSTSYVAPGAGGTTSTRTTYYQGDESWRFSYALMAGFSYEVSESMMLDVGYKYTNIADGTLIADIGGGTSVDHDNIGIHAVRVGLRYMIW